MSEVQCRRDSLSVSLGIGYTLMKWETRTDFSGFCVAIKTFILADAVYYLQCIAKRLGITCVIRVAVKLTFTHLSHSF